MSFKHPYNLLNPKSFWENSVSNTPWENIFNGEIGSFPITPADIICSAGSCFASRISFFLKEKKFNFTNFEPAHWIVDEQISNELGYNQFSARYGNIYTPSQLRQLIEESLGIRPIIYKIEKKENGFFKDLLRPKIHGDGFTALEEAMADRVYHLTCVSEMLKTQDVFIFTLGLTEAWKDLEENVIYGIHPEISLRRNYNRVITPVNFDYVECYNDLLVSLSLIRQLNPKVKFILTVSPVALVATHQSKHALLATYYSKSVLRAVAGKIAEIVKNTDYFPSYEIFNAAQSFGQYLSHDLRDINQRGISVAMNLFENMYLKQSVEYDLAIAHQKLEKEHPLHNRENKKTLADVECDEILNSLFLPKK